MSAPRNAAALRRYRDSRAVHVSCLKRWRAAMRATSGNPRMIVLAHLGEVEVARDAVDRAILAARTALLALRYPTALEA